MPMTIVKRIALASILFSVIAVPSCVLLIGQKLSEGINDAYAQWGAADMVVNYMRNHDGDWPTNWESLESYFASGNGRVGGWTFDKFKSRVRIDFSANSNDLRNASLSSEQVPFDVIGPTSFWSSQIGGGPNEIVHLYFRDRGRYGDAASQIKALDEQSIAPASRP
jgi:hypothetical protein